MAFSDKTEGKQNERNMTLTGLPSTTSVLALAAPLHWPESQLLAEEAQTCQLLQLGHLPGAEPPGAQHRFSLLGPVAPLLGFLSSKTVLAPVSPARCCPKNLLSVKMS
jgi:hypothetical protein